MVCSNFWKLDKIDKIVISLIFIFFAMYSIFDCFCFAYDTNSSFVDFIFVNNVNSDSSKFISSEKSCLITFKVSKGVKYTIHSEEYFSTSPSTNISVYSEKFPSVGDFVIKSHYTSSPFVSEITFVAQYDGYYSYVFTRSDLYKPSLLYVTQDKTVMNTTLKEMVNTVGLSQLWSVFETSIPYVLIVVLFAFGWWFFAHWVKEISKGREF